MTGDGETLERVAKAIHQEWARTTVRHLIRGREESPEAAHDRRWAQVAPKVRDEFMRLAKAACEAMK